MIYVFLMALSLAMDAFAVSVSCGLTVRGFGWRQALLLGAYFGAYQFFMPLAGWYLGTAAAGYIAGFSKYVAFVLLAFIGGKMVADALRPEEKRAPAPQKLTHGRLNVLAVATSIDALAAGFTLAFDNVNIWVSCAVIGAVAFILSFLGGMLGKRVGEKFQARAELIGGLVLIAIGVKTLIF